MAASCTVYEIKCDIGRKTPIFHTPFIFNLHDPLEALGFFLPKILIQTVRVPELLGGAKILPKSSSLCLECNNVTDRQTTDDMP